MSNIDSNFNRFVVGNLKTLSQPGIRDSLLEFHKKWYSANIMTLCIAGKFSLDKLESWVIDKFSPIQNKNVIVPYLCDPDPYPSENLGKFIKYVPIMDKDILNLYFNVPYCQK